MTATTSRPTTEYEELGLSNMARVLPYLSEFDLARWIGTTEGRRGFRDSLPAVPAA